MKVLICSIFRNSAKNVPYYFKFLYDAVINTSGVQFFYSAYENDSNDDTYEALLKYNIFKERSIKSEKLNTEFFRSSTHEDRVINLANARNNALLANNYYKEVDYILQIDSDISYAPNSISNLLNFPEKFDIVSGSCYKSHLKEKDCRDTWATRRNSEEEFGNFFEDKNTKLYDRYYSTFGGFCLYMAQPFKEGLVWSAYNKRKEKYDCDTAVICEDFRAKGYDNIFMDYRTKVKHWKWGFV